MHEDLVIHQVIKDGAIRVESAKLTQIEKNPLGKYPVCIPGIGTRICERCGNPIKDVQKEACPAVPPEERWDRY